MSTTPTDPVGRRTLMVLLASAVAVAALLVNGAFGASVLPSQAERIAHAAPTVAPQPTTGPPTTASVTSAAAPSTVASTVPVDSTPQATDPPATIADQSGNGLGAGGQSQQAQQQGQSDQGSASTQDASSTTADVTMTTTENLLVGPPPSTATTTTVVSQDLSAAPVTRQRSGSDPMIWLIVAGLVAVALALGVTTIAYWKRTRPEAAGGTPSGRGRSRSRYSDLVITVPKPR